MTAPTVRCPPVPVARRVLLIVAALAIAFVLTGCGGDNSGSSDPNSTDYEPANTTLKNAGLEVCSQGQRQLPPTVTAMPDLAGTKVFDVAKDCNGATSTPNGITVFQFTSVDSFNTNTQTIRTELPKAAVLQHYPLVIAATGPDRVANLAAVQKELPPETVTVPTTS
jgi:hypothetical protein